jgi:hypothetical protein
MSIWNIRRYFFILKDIQEKNWSPNRLTYLIHDDDDVGDDY